MNLPAEIILSDAKREAEKTDKLRKVVDKARTVRLNATETGRPFWEVSIADINGLAKALNVLDAPSPSKDAFEQAHDELNAREDGE